VSDVSRETQALLEKYVALLLKWTEKINLIAPSTVPDVWSRHIDDCVGSVQVVESPTGHWVDIGSGGGLPGIIAAILHRETLDLCTLVESDTRKCVFLRTVIRELNLNAAVKSQRIEDVSLDAPEVISARALSGLTRLLDLTSAHRTGKTQLLFQKGLNWESEVRNAQERYHFSLEVHPSLTQEGSVTLLISEVRKRIDD